MQVVKDLVQSSDIITSKDNQGNTALHVAAYRGHLGVVEVLIQAFPLLACSTNNAGDTFLHLVIAGFRTPGFQRLDRQIELMKQLVCGKIVKLQDIINLRNNDGRTALHLAVISNIDSNLVELLMSVPLIDINICDIDNMTPLDLLNQHPRSASSEILIKRLISGGGISNSRDYMARSAIASSLKMQGPVGSPGTSFGISDTEIFLYTGIESALDVSGDRRSSRASSCSSTSKSELCHFETLDRSGNRKPSSANYAARRLKILIGWPHQKEKKISCNSADTSKGSGDTDSSESYKNLGDSENTPTSLRQRFSKPPSLPNNKRTLSVRSTLPSPSTKKKFAAGLMQGVIQAMPHLALPSHSPSGPFLGSSRASPALDKKDILSENKLGEPSSSKPSFDDGTQAMTPMSNSANSKRLMNHYFCFGAQGLSVEDSIVGHQTNRAYKRSVLSVG